MKRLKYIDCIGDPKQYRQWIIQEFGTALLYGDDGKRYVSGRCHVFQLAKLNQQSVEDVLNTILEDVREQLG